MLCVTRFNNETWDQLNNFKRENNIETPIYNSPSRLKDKVGYNSLNIVFEMNNDLNKIMGISLLKNKPFMRQKNIYSDNNYNRFTFHGIDRIDSSEFTEDLQNKIEIIEKIVFTGKTHLKRGSGITVCGQKSFDIHKENMRSFTNFFKQLFKERNNNILI